MNDKPMFIDQSVYKMDMHDQDVESEEEEDLYEFGKENQYNEVGTIPSAQ